MEAVVEHNMYVLLHHSAVMCAKVYNKKQLSTSLYTEQKQAQQHQSEETIWTHK